jgi:hypothetical protein
MNQDDKLKVTYIKKNNKYIEKGNLAIIIPPKILKIPHAIQIFPQYPAPDRWVLVSISEIAKLMREEEDEILSQMFTVANYLLKMKKMK